MGLPTGDFWPLSPRTFVEILDQISERRQAASDRADFRCGVLASLLYNPNRKKGSPALDATHFFPSLKDLVAEGVEPELDMDALMAFAHSVGRSVEDADS